MRFHDRATAQKLHSTVDPAAAKFTAEQRNLKLADKLRELGIDLDNLRTYAKTP
ncbi:MAG: hypothetical protein IM597_18040 [Pseudanabaena sp. M176S2SP2A07QC]|jgi:hypothetical protein|nr:hypothetical protein [Pseudanabaena sp. M090S1SP2A07QC]MCA6506520.1 hypothetical protein [Pseudanabaena sp. M172S2SP2A07QC]MCA6520987.1 hypothetical protein [Pseudanabaena sp. M051S1SP2A07QC]MCA6527595.1 hypothetical protein [Pseudanabaena sp. M179S2SP2A07QC]MCA6536000.1 hypothetical protein [Pseudanabaena sp. M176S2SP2A07QC]MCA6540422.1 hypothetical protein [Pseudanabaena sp. M037S2SP2A07QC]MCA6566135.1 hypothetical protein [Pseudanabaena sp. M151S2SP2A07QC]MCA6577278.1 hypothetical prot